LEQTDDCEDVVEEVGAFVMVPKGNAPRLDGNLDQEEWADARRLNTSGGGVILVKHDGSSVFIGIRAKTQGSVSVAVAHENKKVSLLHASASLATVVFDKRGKTWRARNAFKWECRDAGRCPRAREDWLSYHRRNRWVGTLVSMGAKNEAEFQLSRKLLTKARISVVHFPFNRAEKMFWFPPQMDDSSRSKVLLDGRIPAVVDFAPECWSGLKLVEKGVKK